jgi:hypothetical protein
MNVVIISILIALGIMTAAMMYSLCRIRSIADDRLEEYCKNCNGNCDNCPIGYRLSGKR